MRDLADIELDVNIAVSPFVYLDDSFRQTTRLSIAIPEFFIQDFEQAGSAMREHRLVQSLSLNNSGTLSTKDSLESDINNLDYALTRTMTPNKEDSLLLHAS